MGDNELWHGEVRRRAVGGRVAQQHNDVGLQRRGQRWWRHDVLMAWQRPGVPFVKFLALSANLKICLSMSLDTTPKGLSFLVHKPL